LRVETHGKAFARGDDSFRFRGVTYGTFRPREEDGARFPERHQAKLDLAAMRDAGFTVVRTYTAPPDDVLDLAADTELQVMAGAFYADWRYLVGASRRQTRQLLRDARAEVRSTARRLAGNEHVLALTLGNEVPADVIRWVGTDTVADAIAALRDVVGEEDDDVLVTYANYPTAEYLPLDDLDFLTFNVFLERKADLRRYLTRIHHLAGDRPVVLGEVGLHADDDDRQATVLDWTIETALERGMAGYCVFSWTDEWWVGDAPVDGWSFGLTHADRTSRPALDVATAWNQRSVRDVEFSWPTISIVICAYNAAATLDECLRHTCALDYPDLEIIVVDDGSTDATAEIARRHPRATLLTIPHAGLSVARNEGFRAATNDLVAYLDSDAYPTPDWPWFLALAMDSPHVGGAGGPNLPPSDDPVGAQRVARAPGGPVHVLVSDDRAEHVPGCNMAFWKNVLEEVGGFDPIYTSAGDDVDVCWKVLDADWQIGFHPAAVVWHHRRAGLRTYLRQQRGYGRAEALVEARHPDRFTPTGSARWHGRIYDSLSRPTGRERIYRGPYGTAAYQSIYRSGGHTLDLAHQVGMPIAALVLVTSILLGAAAPPLLGVAGLALLFTITLGVIDAVRVTPPRRLGTNGLAFRAGVAVLHLLQPLVRTWGRVRNAPLARRDLPPIAKLAGPLTDTAGGLLLPATGPREDATATLVAELRRAGYRVVPGTGWEDRDAELIGSSIVKGALVTSAFPEGTLQLRVRRQLRPAASLLWLLAATVVTITAGPVGTVAVAAAAAVEVGRGSWRIGPGFRRAVAGAVG
jgi:glycosyltransferase involved in cell wall biosynthesis